MPDKVVSVPEIGTISFPASMSDADINTAIRKELWQRSVKARVQTYMQGSHSGDIPVPLDPMFAGAGTENIDPSTPVGNIATQPQQGISLALQGGRDIRQALPNVPVATQGMYGVPLPQPRLSPALAHGVSEVLRGGMQASTPLLPATVVAAPVPATLGLLGGAATQEAAGYGLKKSGISPGYQELGSDIAGLLGGSIISHFGSPVVDSAAGAFSDIPGQLANAAGWTGTAAKGAAQGAIGSVLPSTRGGIVGMLTERANARQAVAHGLTALAARYGGHEAALAVEGANMMIGAVQGARSALAERAGNLATQSAADAVRTRIAEMQASPTPPEDAGPFPAQYLPLLDAVSNEVLKKPYLQASEPEQTVIRQAVRQEIARQRPSEATTPQPVGPIYTARNAVNAMRAGTTAPAAAVPEEVPAASRTATPTTPATVPTPAARSPQTPAPVPVVPSPVPAPQPAVPETPAAAVSSAPAATPPATVPSPAAAASSPDLQTRSSPASPVPPSVVPSSPATQGSETGGVVPSTGTTVVPAGVQHYYPIGSPTHIPTPAELGLGVYSEGGSGQAASGRVLRAENEKGYAAALWAYKNGITDPTVFDRMTEAEKRTFMNGNKETGETGALQHAREMNNPAPKTKYHVNPETNSIFGENTLEFAKAHLRKLVEEGGPRPALAKESVERLRSPAEEATAPEAVEGMRQEQQPKSLGRQIIDALSDETGSVGPGSGFKGFKKPAKPDVSAHEPPPADEPRNPSLAFPLEKTLTRLRQTLGRKEGVGEKENPVTVFPDKLRPAGAVDKADARGPIATGNISNTDWLKRVQRQNTPEEIAAARQWYHELRDKFEAMYPGEGGKWMDGFLFSNQMVSPADAYTVLLRVADQVAGRPKYGYKTAGLAEEVVRNVLQGIPVTKGVGAKLSDFSDIGHGKLTRSVMGDDPRGGAPATGDVHAMRDVGYVDDTLRNYLAKHYGEKAVKNLKVDAGDSPTDAQYERINQFYNGLSKWLNTKNVDGGGWTPGEVQAVGWVSIQKAVGEVPQFLEDAIAHNTRTVALGMKTGHGTPLERAGVTDIPQHHMDWMTGQIADYLGPGVKVLKQHTGPGAYLTEREASTHPSVLASPEGIRDFMDMAGYAGQQSEVLSSKEANKGNTAIDILHNDGRTDLATEAGSAQLHAALQKALQPAGLEDMAAGFSPIQHRDGRVGMRFMNRNGKWTPEEVDAFIKAAQSVPQAYSVDIRHGPVELIKTENNWKDKPSGEDYLNSLVGRGRVREAAWVRDQLGPQFQARLTTGLRGTNAEGAGPAPDTGASGRTAASGGRGRGSPASSATGQAGQPGTPQQPTSASSAQAVTEPARATVERLRKRKSP